MSNLPIAQEEQEPVRILDENDPRSLINLLPNTVRPSIRAAALRAPHLFVMGEEDFIAFCRKESVHFNSTDHMLRDQLWIEFHHARHETGKVMSLGRIISGAISDEGFKSHYVKNVYKAAWLCVMPLSYERILRRNLAQLARNMSIIADMPVIDPVTGKLDRAVAAIQFGLYKMTEVTLHGTPTQRIEQKTMSLNVTRHEGAGIYGAIEGKNGKSAMDVIKELERREREASHVPRLAEWQTMPVTGVDVEKKRE